MSDQDPNLKNQEKAYREKIAQDPNSAHHKSKLSYILIQQEQYKEAEQYLRGAIALWQKTGQHVSSDHNNLGICLTHQGYLRQAEVHYRKAIEIDRANTTAPNNRHYYKNLAYCLERQKRYEEAAKAFKDALLFQADNPALYSSLGNCLFEQKSYKDAEQAYNDAISFKSDNPAYHYSRGLCLENLGDLPRAEAAFWTATEYGPDDPDYYKRLSIVNEKMGYLYQAMFYADLALHKSRNKKSPEEELAKKIARIYELETTISCLDYSADKAPIFSPEYE